MNFANGAVTTLSGSITAGAGSLAVADASRFPATPFHICIDTELMTVTANLGGLFTVTRGIEGTSAAAHTAGALVVNTVTAADYAGFGGATQPECIVHQSASQTTTTGVAVGVNMDVTDYDPTGMHDLINTSRINILVAGTYLLTGFFTFKAALGYREASLQKNGVASGTTLDAQGAQTANDFISLSTTTIDQLIVGDYVELVAYQTTGGNLQTFNGAQNKPRLKVIRLGI